MLNIITAENALISVMENIIDMKLEYDKIVKNKYNSPENISLLFKQAYRILYSLQILSK